VYYVICMWFEIIEKSNIFLLYIDNPILKKINNIKIQT
jgi:hypothetical protein